MDLKTRAEKLAELGFFGKAKPDLDALVKKAETFEELSAKDAPATALLRAAGRLLEIPTDSGSDSGGYVGLLRRIETFCEGAFSLEEASEEPMDQFVQGDEDEDGYEPEIVPGVLILRFTLDDAEYETEVTYDEDVDLGFLGELDEHLEGKKEPRRLCPIVEIMDDTARYVFLEPEKVEQAELAELIAAPDFEA